MNVLLPLYTKASIFVQNRAEKIRKRSEHGQNTLEYVGLAVLIAAVVVLISQQANLSQLATKFSNVVSNILKIKP